MDRSQKADAVAQLSEVFAQSGVAVVTCNLGLVEQSTELRSKMREAGATCCEEPSCQSPEGHRLRRSRRVPDRSDRPVIPRIRCCAKAVVEFAKTTDKIEIVGGSMGVQKLDEAGVKALAAMPSLDELRGTIAGSSTRRQPRLSARSRNPRRSSHAFSVPMAPRKPRKSRFDVRTHIHRGIRPSGHPGLIFGVKHHGRYRQAC